MAQQRISAGQFKARCLALMDKVKADRVPIVITKRGKPVAKLVPVEDAAPCLFGALQDTVVVKGDIVQPVGDPWEADA